MGKAIYYSVATAIVAGLLTGEAMRIGPDTLADRPIGPQILIAPSGERIDPHGWYAEPAGSTHNGQFPEYVMGTDWAQPVVYDAPVETYEEASAEYVQAEAEAFAAPVKISAPPEPTNVVYPSVDGDILAGLHEDAEAEATEDAAVQPS